MNQTVRTLRRVVRYVGHFGPRAGLRAARIHRSNARPIGLRIPDLPSPLWVRPRSADVETFEEVFVDHHYHVPFANFSPRQILDLGANIGLASVSFAARWPEARILAVEPVAQNHELLHLNTAAWPGIVPLHAAVWSHATQVQIANPDAPANAYQMTESEMAGQRVPAFTVAELAARANFDRIDLVKMDVEGAEAEVFRHDPSWLDRVGVLVVELHDWIVPGCAQALCAALQGRRFQMAIVGANLAIDLR